MTRAVLFDAGNTLVHLDYAFIATVLAAAGHARGPLDIRQAEYAAKAVIDREFAPDRTPPESVEGLLWPDDGERPAYFSTIMRRLGVPAADIPSLLDVLQAHNRTDCLWRVVEPGTGPVLDALRARGFVLGVVSNADGRIEADLDRRGLGRHFATVVDSHVVGVEKPDRAIFDLALARLGDIPADAAVYVGDVFGIDVCGARGAGLAPVLLDPLGDYPGVVNCPRIRRLEELLDLLPAAAR